MHTSYSQEFVSVLPTICLIENNGVRFYFLDYFEQYTKDQNFIDQCLNFFIKGCDYRHYWEYQGSPVLLSIFDSEKAVYISTRALNTELFILKLINSNVKGQESKELVALKTQLENFVGKISSLDMNQFPSDIEKIVSQYKLLEIPKIMESSEYQQRFDSLMSVVVEYRASFFEKLSDFGLKMTAKYALIRVHILKFLAVLPCLDHDREGVQVKRIFLESLRRFLDDDQKIRLEADGSDQSLPIWMVRLTRFIYGTSQLLPELLLAFLIRKNVAWMAKRFIAGEDIIKAQSSLRLLTTSGRDFTLDQLGELVVSPNEADIYLKRVLDLITGLSDTRGRNNAGILKRHISIKVSALGYQLKDYCFEDAYEKIAPRLLKILEAAKLHQVFINVDAEHYHFRDLLFNVYKKVLLNNEQLADYADTGIVLQAYLRDSFAHYQDILSLAKERKMIMPIRLVKGAYWDAETIEADAHHFMAPQFLNKEETDCFLRLLAREILCDGEYVQLCLGSHNASDHIWVETLREKHFPQAPIIEHQCLHMTYEALSQGLCKKGYVVRNYLPIGDLLVGMGYLVRRIMENSSQVGVLKQMRSDQSVNEAGDPFVLLNLKKNKNRHKLAVLLTDDFLPINKVCFHQKENVKLAIETISNNNIENHHLNETSIEAAISKVSGVTHWSDCNPSLRIVKLLKFAHLLTIDRFKLAAIIIHEAKKTLEEAFADVDEAIDFVNYYCRQEFQLYCKNPFIKNRKLVGVIAPWNFPLAIPCGMLTGALVAGNKAVLKPAEQTPLVAFEMFRLLRLAGIDETVTSLVQGGASEGAALVAHPKVKGVVFTGSKAVGTSIFKEKIKGRDNFVVAEMGGKNAIIVTGNCELDETITGIIYSAFAHAGQKCSACSRILIDQSILEQFIYRFKNAVQQLKVGVSTDFSTDINPVITPKEQQRITQQYLEILAEVEHSGGRVIVDRLQQSDDCAVGPLVVEIPYSQTKNPSSYFHKELFAPIVHIVSYGDLARALELFNMTQFALTGGIYSQSQDDIDYFLQRAQAGNLYVNRPNTGARVGIEPFGGFKMSGTGPKAGGTEYLNVFHDFYNLGENIVLQNDSLQSSTLNNVRIPLNANEKLKSIDSLISIYFSEYHFYSQENHQINRDKISEFFIWLTNDGENFLKMPSWNFSIPGQLSFNSYSLNYDSLVIVSDSNNISPHLFLNLISAVFCGVSVEVNCLKKVNDEVWQKLFTLIRDIQDKNFHLSLRVLEGIADFSNNAQSYYLDLKPEDEKTLVKSILGRGNSYFLPKLYYGQHDILKMDWKLFLMQYLNARSVAVNTMRHGAPLLIESIS